MVLFMARMDIFILLFLLSCVSGEPGEPPNLATTNLDSEEESKVIEETEKSEEKVTENPSSVNATVTPESDVKNATEAEETIESIVLPEAGSAAKEHSSSLAIFFLLFILILCIFLIHLLLRIKFHYLPESLAIVFLGAVVGMFMMALSETETKRMEAFSPTMFFLVLLPPIIFESGYNLHKGNFFQNIGSIMVFAILGTAISALVVGGGVYLLGLADVVYKLDFIQSFAFGSLISAVDPVATLAIFQGIDILQNVGEIINIIVINSPGCGPCPQHVGLRGEHPQRRRGHRDDHHHHGVWWT